MGPRATDGNKGKKPVRDLEQVVTITLASRFVVGYSTPTFTLGLQPGDRPFILTTDVPYSLYCRINVTYAKVYNVQNSQMF